MRHKIYYLASLWALAAQAQERMIDTVFVSDKAWQKANLLQVGSKYSAQNLQKNSQTFSDFLSFQSNIYTKEQGRGGISSPAFRGTTAQQTAVLWNGLNINSGFLGQTDLNTISGLSYEQILIKPGENAIGGSLVLNNQMAYNKGFTQQVFANYGNFASLDVLSKTAYSNDKISISAKINLNQSENNYRYQLGRYQGQIYNAEFDRKSIDLAAAYRWQKHQLQWFTQHYFSDQNFPVLDLSGQKTKYQNRNLRSLGQWLYHDKNYQQQLKLAYLEENFAYFADIDQPNSSGGHLEQYVAQHQGDWKINQEFALAYKADYKHVKAQGYNSGIQNPIQNTLAFSATIKQNIGQNFYHEAGINQSYLAVPNSPILYHYHNKINVFSFWQSQWRFTKNFRIPSFNDMYWKDAGNPDLKPETAYLFEANQIFFYQDFKLNLTAYYNQISDMIRWVPTGSVWKPTNTNQVRIKGLEANLDYQYQWQKLKAKLNTGYAYTQSINQENGFQLMYVPQHKAHVNTDISYATLSFFSQWLYQGLRYSSSNEDQATALKSYFLSNLGLNWQASKQLNVGLKVHNVGAQVYQTVAQMPMPLRYYSCNLNLNL